MRNKRIAIAILLSVGSLLSLATGLVLAHAVTLWEPDGVALCTATGTQYEQDIVSYNMNGAAVVWTDGRDQATTGLDIYTQYVQSDGVKPWVYTVGATQGVGVCTHAGAQYSPALCESGGNLFYAWVDERDHTTSKKDIYAQRVNSDGSIDYTHWITDGYPVCPLSGDEYNPQIVKDNAGGAIIVWESLQAAGDVNLFAQRLNADGAPQWSPLSTGTVVCEVASDQKNHAIIPDGAGGAIVVWEDYRSSTTTPDIYAQRISAAGTRLWPANGVPICVVAGAQREPQLASDGNEGSVIVWQDGRGAADDIYAQCVDKDGNVQWAANGVVVCNPIGSQQNPRMIAVETEYVIAWRDFRGGTLEGDVYAQRIDQSGTRKWIPANGVIICDAAGAQAWPTLALDNLIAPSAVIISWQDSRSLIPEEYDIYAQRVESDGTIDWAANGVPVCTYSGTQEAPVSAADAHGGVIIVWQDNRGRTAPDVYGLYGQRIRDYDHQIYLPLVRRQ